MLLIVSLVVSSIFKVRHRLSRFSYIEEGKKAVVFRLYIYYVSEARHWEVFTNREGGRCGVITGDHRLEQLFDVKYIRGPR